MTQISQKFTLVFLTDDTDFTEIYACISHRLHRYHRNLRLYLSQITQMAQKFIGEVFMQKWIPQMFTAMQNVQMNCLGVTTKGHLS